MPTVLSTPGAVVDTRILGRPDKFDGQDKNWGDFKFGLMTVRFYAAPAHATTRTCPPPRDMQLRCWAPLPLCLLAPPGAALQVQSRPAMPRPRIELGTFRSSV